MTEQQQVLQQQPLSISALQFAEAHYIGTVVKEYKSKTFMKSLLGSSLSVLGSAFLLVCVSVAALVHTLSAIRTGFYGIALGLALLSFGIVLLRVASRNRRTHISLGTDGLMRVKGNQAEAIRWDHIAAVQKTFTRVQNNYFLHAYLLLRRDGSVLALEKSYQGFNELGKTIEEEVMRRLLPAAIAAYDAGSPVNFGAVLVSEQGISVQEQKEQKTLAWNEFKTIKVHDGRVKIIKQGALAAWETLLIPQVPNLCVFLALIEYRRTQKPQQ